MTIDEFLDVLQDRRLAPTGVLRQLREKHLQGDRHITPKSILKLLVQKEFVSREQAAELLATSLTVSEKVESSILGLAPLPDMIESQADRSTSVLDDDDGELMLTPIEEEPSPERRPAKSRSAASPSQDPTSGKGKSRKERNEDDRFFERGAAEDPLGLGPAPILGEPPPLADKGPAGIPVGLKLEKGGNRKGGKGKRSGKGSQKRWDSPLVLFGGGAVIGLGVLAGLLYFLIFRENADALLKSASDAAAAGNYEQAITQYQEFTQRFSRNPNLSLAKVRLGMTQLWQAVEGTQDFAGALTTAQRVIDEIENEPAFISDGDQGEGLSQAKRELSTILPQIARGLADQAEAAADKGDEKGDVVKERIDQVKTALALCANTKYVPDKFRNDAAILEIKKTLDRVEQRQSRKSELAATLSKMDQSIASGDTAASYSAYMSILKQYPALADEESLAAKVLDTSKAEKAAVKFVEDHRAAATTAPKSAVVAELALADRRGPAAEVTSGAPVIFKADGALYGLRAADGSLLWRRYVGPDSASLPLTTAGGIVIAADSQAGELICVQAETGKLIWRLPLKDTLATAVPLGERLLIAGASGKLYVVEAASGELVGHVQFSQPIRVPAVNERGDRIYLVGDHSTLYTLAAKDFSCLGVYYLGHATGSIVTPPLAILNKAVVADNSGSETSRIRVISLDERGVCAKEVAGARLEGLVVTPLQAAQRRFAAATTLGQAVIFEVGTADDKSGLTSLASRAARDQEQMAQFALVHQGHLWLAGRQLSKLAILPTGNQLPVQSLERNYDGDAFDYPLQASGDLVIHLRRPVGQAGVVAAATDAKTNKSTWETALAAPLAGPPAVDSSGPKITAADATGAVYVVDRQAMARRVLDHAERLGGPPFGQTTPLDSTLDLGQGRLAIGGIGSPTLLHWRPGNPRQALKAVPLPGPLSCSLVAWRGGLVAATDAGQVSLLDADSAAPLATPFQPELIPGRSYHWVQPTAVGAGDQSLLALSDGVDKVYLVTVKAEPQPHLEMTASADIGASHLATPLAAVGQRLFAGNEAGQLASYSLPDLKAGEPLKLGGRIVWGPHAVGDGILAAVDSGEVLMVGGDGAIRWRRPLKHGEAAGTPAVTAGEAVVLHRQGGLSKIKLADGAETGYVDLNQPAVAGPTPFGDRLIVAAPDGAVLVVNRP